MPTLRQWFERITYEGMDEGKHQQRREHARREEAQQEKELQEKRAWREKRLRAKEGKPDLEEARIRSSSREPNSKFENTQKQDDDFQWNQLKPPTDPGMGSPGDFRFSDVPKPEPYLNTYRDLNKPDHVTMLKQLYEGTKILIKTKREKHYAKPFFGQKNMHNYTHLIHLHSLFHVFYFLFERY